MSRRTRLTRLAVVAAGLLLAAAASATAEVVILRDGFVIQGNVRKETELVQDKASGQGFTVIKAGGFDFIDEGPKLVIFSSHHKQLGEISKDIKLRPDYRPFTTPYARRANSPLPPGMVGRGAPPDFDAKWKRTLVVDVPSMGGFDRIEQQITYLDPYYCYVWSPTHSWALGFRTSELEPYKTRKLLYAHPELAEPDGKCDPLKRIAIARFCVDAGWLYLAKEEVERLKKDHPGPLPKEAQENFDVLVKEIDRATVELVITEAELAMNAGRYRYAGELLAVFPEKIATPEQLKKGTELMARHKAAISRYTEGRRMLRKLIDETTRAAPARAGVAAGGGPVMAAWPVFRPSTQLVSLAAAAEVVYDELHPDSAHRIEFFVNLADTAERQRAAGMDPDKKPEELLATAVSGWAKGRSGASPVPDAALRAWTAREMVLDSQRAADRNGRFAIISQLKKLQPVGPDELVQVISLLPPAYPEDLAARTGVLVSEKDGAPPETYRRTSLGTPDHPGGIEYLVKLPPEYHHGRAYPVLIALTSPGMNPEMMTLALAREAERNGYILVSPVWSGPFDTKGWQFKGEDHDYVTAVLRDVIRHFTVDNDRVFMFGAGDGGSMAFDVGLSHPDLFAGVLLMSPSNPRWIGTSMQYWQNAQKLPFYVVTGQLAGKPNAELRFAFDRWMPNGFPAINAIYKGRGLEWYPAETPVMFDWMNRKKRVQGTATLSLGTNRRFEWQIMRQTDNRFYWLGADRIAQGNLFKENNPGNTVPAGLQGDIRGNLIDLQTRGVRTVDVWLSRDMIDWSKPVRVNLNGTPAYNWKARVLEPDLEVLLEDYAARGDRRMLFLAKLEFQSGN
jgi:pimeloyl-ACP methyl ester carboxylesterase